MDRCCGVLVVRMEIEKNDTERKQRTMNSNRIYTLALTAHWRSRFVARHTVEVFRLYNCTPPCTVLGGGFSWCAVMREGSRQNESKVQITPSLTSPRCLAFPLGGQKYCRAKSLRPMMIESYPISGTMQNWIAIKQFAHFTGRSVIESVTENLATVPVCFVCVCVDRNQSCESGARVSAVTPGKVRNRWAAHAPGTPAVCVR